MLIEYKIDRFIILFRGRSPEVHAHHTRWAQLGTRLDKRCLEPHNSHQLLLGLPEKQRAGPTL